MPSRGRQRTGRRLKRFTKRLSAMQIAKENRRRLNNSHENKYRDVAPNAITTAVAGAVYILSNIETGNTDDTRIGEKIHAKSLEVNINDYEVAVGQTTRIVVFIDKQQHGTAPTVTQVLTSADVLSLTNRSNDERFTILRDITYPKTLVIEGNSTMTKHLRIRLNRNIHYIGDTSLEASMGAGNIYMLVVSRLAGAANTFRYSSRLIFTD